MREFDLLEHVYRESGFGPQVAIGPGDDLALVHLAGRRLLAGVDQVVDGRHVRLETTPLALVGRKAITRSVSDIAAMAGIPVATLAAVTLPPEFGTARATALFDAMRATAQALGCPLIGGDIAFHLRSDQPLVCAVTVLAEPAGEQAVTRAGALAGDTVHVTGSLGGTIDADGGGHHLTFVPRLAEAADLVRTLGARLHAMIDLSDGLGRDAAHIAERSGVRLELDARRLPCRPGVSWRDAAAGGEDYELLFTASGAVPDRIGDGISVTTIGRVLDDGDGPRVVFRDGDDRVDGTAFGWEHAS